MIKIIQFSALICFLFTFNLRADESEVKKSIYSFMPQAKIQQVVPSEIKGLYEVTIGANLLYVTENGKYIIQGQVFDTESKKSLTETKLATMRTAELEKLGLNNMIVFAPQSSKHFVSIFTDIDCGYCRKLHSEIDQYLAQGITIRYLFYPRAGKGSDSYNKAISVWCAADRQKALTAAKKNESLDAKKCENPVDKHIELAEEFGMSGTPLIITEKGNLLPGYVPAQKLADILAKE